MTMTTIKDVYTRKVSGETFEYEIDFNSGDAVEWTALVYQNGELKGRPRGSLASNLLNGPALEDYLIAYVENMIERGLDVEE